MRITALETQIARPERINLYLDGVFHGALAAEVVFAEALHVGDELTEARLAGLARRDAVWRAKESALLLLSFRPRSAGELRRRLAEKGYEAPIVDEVVERLVAAGVVDDAAFSELFVRGRVRGKPQGRRRLEVELRRKGVDAETIDAAIDDVMAREETDDLALARKAAAKFRVRPGEAPVASRRRLYGFLGRRGFAPDVLRAVADEVLGARPAAAHDEDDDTFGED